MNRKMRILLADDHAVVRQGFRMILSAQPDFEVVAEAANGREAVEMAEKTRPDVVVMDVSMPGMSGFELLKKIRERGVQTAAMFLTAHDALDDLRIALCDPCKRKEGGLRFGIGKQLQNPVHVALDAAFLTVPVAAMNMGKKGFDLKIVFDIDCHGVASRTPRRGHRATAPLRNRVKIHKRDIQLRVSRAK